MRGEALYVRLAVLTCIAGIVASMIGCGDDDSASSADAIKTSSLSRAEYVKKATAACSREEKDVLKKASAYIAKEESEGLPAPVLEANVVKEILVPAVEAKTAVIRRLGAPSGDEEQIEGMLELQEEGIDQAKELEKIEPGKTAIDLFADGDKKFAAYKLTRCSSRVKPEF